MNSIIKVWDKLVNLEKFFNERFIDYLNSTPDINLMEINEIQDLWETYEREKSSLDSEVNAYLHEKVIKDALVFRLNKWILTLRELIVIRKSKSEDSIEVKHQLKLISEELDSVILNYNERIMEFRQIAFPSISSMDMNRYIRRANLKNSLLEKDLSEGLAKLRQVFPNNNEIISQIGILKDLSNLISTGKIDSLRFIGERNRIRFSIFELIDELI